VIYSYSRITKKGIPDCPVRTGRFLPGNPLVAGSIPERMLCAKNIFHTNALIGRPPVSLTMDILVSAFVIILAIAVAVILYYILKSIIALVVNAIVGVIVLFVLNLFHVMSLAGASDLPIDWITVLVSAIGGLVGVIIIVVLHLAGVVL
jgi:hypothetical protein